MEASVTPAFKKPVLIGKVGKLPKQIKSSEPPKKIKNEEHVEPEDKQTTSKETDIISNDLETTDLLKNDIPKVVHLQYTEPEWSGSPNEDTEYGLEILKQGSIIGNHSLVNKSYWVFGRLPQCDISMAHPTVSRYHAILQYRKEDAEGDKKGYYLYDLGSTHGTFLNKLRLKAQKYVRVQVGHMIKLGCSSRSYILVGPAEDQEVESELTVTELKQKRQEEINRRDALIEEAQLKAKEERLQREKREEERGVDWGMGEDADIESDLAENPYAQTNNEELYIDDPKKALRGFMEREGVEFEYDCTEQGIGQYLCKVVLPIDDERGRSIVAEVLHKGKKKETVLQCALEACRILDRYGVLRQANHESKKRKAKNWQDDDYYDSDDDTFLDRTGTIERKRENRMKAKQPQKAETYQSLLDKEKVMSGKIKYIQAELSNSQNNLVKVSEDEDPLDSFMSELKQPSLNKEKAMELKTELVRLKQNHAQVVKLINIARPADLPPLIVQYDTQSTTKKNNSSKLPFFGKRLKVKVHVPHASSVLQNDDEEEEDEKTTDNLEEVMDVDVKEDAQNTTMAQFSSAVKEGNVSKIDESSCKDISMDTAQESTIDAAHSRQKSVAIENVEKKPEDVNNKRKKNQRRIIQREEKLEKEKRRGYEEDRRKEDYNMWMPPENQTGDGKTSLNDKFGY